MIIILDSNEYINYFNKKDLLDKVFSNQDILIYINDIIIREVIRNLKELQIKEFYNLIFNKNINFYGHKMPLQLLAKYKKLGLKKGEIAIAAFCESISADYLVTENRHFLKSKKFDRFEVLSLRKFLDKSREQTRY